MRSGLSMSVEIACRVMLYWKSNGRERERRSTKFIGATFQQKLSSMSTNSSFTVAGSRPASIAPWTRW
ncbi:hypothetical protein D3C76_1244730 [compost metagenome]